MCPPLAQVNLQLRQFSMCNTDGNVVKGIRDLMLHSAAEGYEKGLPSGGEFIHSTVEGINFPGIDRLQLHK
jgi:hypothetical protein